MYKYWILKLLIRKYSPLSVYSKQRAFWWHRKVANSGGLCTFTTEPDKVKWIKTG